MSMMTPPVPVDELEWLSQKRQETSRLLEEIRQRMRKTYAELTSTPALPQSKWAKILYFADRAPSIYQGIKTGYRVIGILTSIMAFTRIFKRRK